LKTVEKAGGIVLNPDGDILIITNDIGKVTLPKGSLEPGETHKETAWREVLEEGGLKKIEIIRELGIIIRPGYTDDNHDFPSVVKHIRMYLCTTNEMELDPNVRDVKKAQWVSQDKVPAMLSWAEEAEFFMKHRAELESVRRVI
jgi:ADP-ribose pyrophosphatase YjhB (NUDIX family)